MAATRRFSSLFAGIRRDWYEPFRKHGSDLPTEGGWMSQFDGVDWRKMDWRKGSLTYGNGACVEVAEVYL